MFLPNGETPGPSLSYGELAAAVEALAGGLHAAGLSGQPVLLPYPPGLDFIVGLLACFRAGAIAVPCEQPSGPAASARLRAIAADCEAPVALTPRAALASAARWMPPGPRLVAAEELTGPPAPPPTTPIALLQYTSGSTSTPKGVVLTHANLMGNLAAIESGSRQTADSVFLSWLPLFHDMGLIGMALMPIYLGARCVLMPPRAFLYRPRRWLGAIARYRATISGGPNFAFELCAERITPEDMAGWDLSCWELAYSGAEPVHAAALERFAEAFDRAGFNPKALYPCYGLAEATAFFAGGTETGARVVRVNAEALQAGRAVRDPAGLPLVSCGVPHAGHTLRLVDPATRLPTPAGHVGELWLQGPSIGQGYYLRPEASLETFGARLADGTGPYLRTGDLGFLDEGEVVVCGRLKDLLIVRGANHYPQDLERTARGSHAALAGLEGAALLLPDGQLALVHELAPAAAGEAGAVRQAVKGAIATHHRLSLDQLLFIKAGTLPRTSSGKVKRAECARQLLAQELELL